jgi:phosphate transport system substrate-binding protein
MFLPGCQHMESTPSTAGIRIAASPQTAQFAEWLVAGYRQLYPEEIEEEVQILPETELWNALEQGDAQAVVYLEDSSPDAYWTASLGWTALTFAVSLTNPVQNLTRNQVRDIYQGRIEDWAALGGKRGAIARYSFPNGTDMSRLLSEYVLDGGQPVTDVFSAPETWAMQQALAEDSDSLGYMLCIDVDMQAMTPLSVDGVRPDYTHARDGSYPFGIPVLLSADNNPGDVVKRFAGWAQSESGQEIFRMKCEFGDF